MSNTDHQKDV